MRVRNLRLLALTGAMALAGCPNAELAPLEPCTVSGSVTEVRQNAVDKVDVLFVIDDSNSMAQEQAALAQQLPRMVQILASGDLEAGSPDGTPGLGEADFPPVKDMHLGVVSSNLGAPVDLIGEQLPPTPSGQACVSPGDDGVLQFPNTCASNTREGNYLTFFAETGDVTALGNDFSCVSQLGIDGCGFEQQLDSMLKALVGNTNQGYTFYNGSFGQGGYANPNAVGGNAGATGANSTFLREEAVLAVIVVSDEEDCSVPDQNAALVSFAQSGNAVLKDTVTGTDIAADLSIPLNLRCGTYPNAQQPIQRYVDGLRSLKPGNTELVIFAAIAGVPPELADPNTGEYPPAADILANPAMAFRSNMPGDPNNNQAQPEPTCRVPNPSFDPNLPEDNTTNPQYLVSATPARRMVELAGEFGENGVIRSICTTDEAGNADYTSALDAIIKKISDQLKGACLPRALTRNSKGVVACDIVEWIRNDGSGEALCDASKGRTPLRTDSETDEVTGEEIPYQVCNINQVAVVEGNLMPNPDFPDFGVVGTYYDDFTEEVKDSCGDPGQRITFTANADPPRGALVRIECLQPVIVSGTTPKGRAAVGLSCEDDMAVCDQASCTAQDMQTEGGCDQLYKLQCEEFSNTCQLTCANQSECPNGWSCVPDRGLCVLPTCPALEL